LREVEEELRDRNARGRESTEGIAFSEPRADTPRLLERNFFSILFVSIFQSIGIEKDRVRDYAAIIHMVRGIVTANRQHPSTTSRKVRS